MSFQTRQAFVIFRTQTKIFLMKSEIFLILHSSTTEKFKAQEGSKDIVKTVHVTSVVQP